MSKSYLTKHHPDSANDRWLHVKPGVAATVEEISTGEIVSLMGVQSDLTSQDPSEILGKIEAYWNGSGDEPFA